MYITLRLRLGLLLFAFHHVCAYSHCYCIAFSSNKQNYFLQKAQCLWYPLEAQIPCDLAQLKELQSAFLTS